MILPFFHIFGFNGAVLPRLACGTKLITIPKFVPELFIDVLTKHRVRILELRYILYFSIYNFWKCFASVKFFANFSFFLFFFYHTGDGPLHSPADTFVLQRLHIPQEREFREHASLHHRSGSTVGHRRGKLLSKVSVEQRPIENLSRYADGEIFIFESLIFHEIQIQRNTCNFAFSSFLPFFRKKDSE